MYVYIYFRGKNINIVYYKYYGSQWKWMYFNNNIEWFTILVHLSNIIIVLINKTFKIRSIFLKSNTYHIFINIFLYNLHMLYNSIFTYEFKRFTLLYVYGIRYIGLRYCISFIKENLFTIIINRILINITLIILKILLRSAFDYCEFEKINSCKCVECILFVVCK